MKKVKLGLIGCGTVTLKAHLPALMNDPRSRTSGYLFQITAICGLDTDNLDYLKSILPQVEVYQDYNELLRQADCEAVLVATGELYHPQISHAALKSGKYVLCEKPFGVSGHEIRRVFSEDDNALYDRLQIAFNKRYYSAYHQYLDYVNKGSFNPPVCGSFQFITEQGRKPGWDGILSNLIHYCDLILAVFGRVNSLTCYSHTSANGISLSASMQAESGGVISFIFTSAASWTAHWHEEWQLIDDQKRRIAVKNCSDLAYFSPGSPAEYFSDSNSIFWLPDPHGYVAQIRSFYDLVCGKREKPEVTLQDALAAHDLYDRIEALVVYAK